MEYRGKLKSQVWIRQPTKSIGRRKMNSAGVREKLGKEKKKRTHGDRRTRKELRERHFRRGGSDQWY